MSVVKFIEISSSSPKSTDDAVQRGLKKAAESVKNIKGAWVNEVNVICTPDGSVTEWRVNMRVSFLVD